MEIEPKVLTLVICGALTAGAVAVQHMAFRTPKWQRKELHRRFIGDGSLLFLFLVVPVLLGGADLLTWAGITTMFAIAGVVKIYMAWSDSRRKADLIARIEGRHEERENRG